MFREFASSNVGIVATLRLRLVWSIDFESKECLGQLLIERQSFVRLRDRSAFEKTGLFSVEKKNISKKIRLSGRTRLATWKVVGQTDENVNVLRETFGKPLRKLLWSQPGNQTNAKMLNSILRLGLKYREDLIEKKGPESLKNGLGSHCCDGSWTWALGFQRCATFASSQPAPYPPTP